MKQEGIHDFLFRQFNKHLEKSGFRATGGQIVDATFQEVPVQHNTPEEKQKIQETGEAPEEWTAKKKAHKDMDARWTKKRNCLHYGYKNHINIDRRHKFIREYCVISAQVHDSQCFTEMVDERAVQHRVKFGQTVRTCPLRTFWKSKKRNGALSLTKRAIVVPHLLTQKSKKIARNPGFVAVSSMFLA